MPTSVFIDEPNSARRVLDFVTGSRTYLKFSLFAWDDRLEELENVVGRGLGHHDVDALGITPRDYGAPLRLPELGFGRTGYIGYLVSIDYINLKNSITLQTDRRNRNHMMDGSRKISDQRRR